MNRLKHIGSRIKLFRKHQNLTLEELAYMVHKSTSTLCKYEAGSISIDILTLSDIANALGVDISQLIDFETAKAPLSNSSSNFFRRHKRLYVYYHFIPRKKVMQGMMEITGSSADGEGEKVVLYLNASAEHSSNDPVFIYTGTMSSDESFAFIEMQNASGMKDKLYILAKSPYWVQSKAKGMVLSVSQAYACPSSGMFLFSAENFQ